MSDTQHVQAQAKKEKKAKNKNSKKFKILQQKLEGLEAENKRHQQKLEGLEAENKRLQAEVAYHIEAQEESYRKEDQQSRFGKILQDQFNKLSGSNQRKYFRTIQKCMAIDDEKNPDTVHLTKNGLQCIMFNDKDCCGSYNGYVKIPKGHPYYGKDPEDLYCLGLDAPGGITYAQHDNPLADKGESKEEEWWIGYDHRHNYDYGLWADCHGFITDFAVFTNVDMMHDELDKLTKKIVEVHKGPSDEAEDDDLPELIDAEDDDLPELVD